MLKLLTAELTKRNALKGALPDIIDRITEANPLTTIAPRMKQTIAVSELTLFASQFRRNIQHWDGVTEVPINAISFAILASGKG